MSWPAALRSVVRSPMIWAVETLSGGKTRVRKRILAIPLPRQPAEVPRCPCIIDFRRQGRHRVHPGGSSTAWTSVSPHDLIYIISVAVDYSDHLVRNVRHRVIGHLPY